MLVDRRILARIVEAAHIGKSDTVLEAGTGKGILTEELCKSARRVVSYEVDKKLYQQALKHLQFQNLELVNADLFKTTDLRCDVFISNLPYSRSRDAFEWLAAKKFREAVVMVQEEFADKLTARPADKNYRAISALAAHCFSIEKIVRVGRRSFEPQPKVESVVIKIIPVNTVRKEAVKALNLLFSKRNKIASTVASNNGIRVGFGSKRIDQLAPTDLIRLAELITNVRPI